MKAALLNAFGTPPHVGDIAEPQIPPGSVRVHVRAVAIHPLVRALASGKHYASPKQLPVVLGVDGIGTLDSGQRVYFGPLRPPFGALAERLAVPQDLCAPLTGRLDDSSAAALMNPGLAALLPLTWRAKLQPGEQVCILGATGAAGQLAVRLAAANKAQAIVAVGRRADVLAELTAAGATSTINLATTGDLPAAFTEAAAPDGFDVIIDYLWGAPAQALAQAIARNKYAKEIRWVEVGEMAGPEVSIPGGLLRSTGLTLSGFGLRSTGLAPHAVQQQGVAQLTQHAEAGLLKVDTRVVSLDDVPKHWNSNGNRLVVRMPI